MRKPTSELNRFRTTLPYGGPGCDFCRRQAAPVGCSERRDLPVKEAKG